MVKRHWRTRTYQYGTYWDSQYFLDNYLSTDLGDFQSLEEWYRAVEEKEDHLRQDKVFNSHCASRCFDPPGAPMLPRCFTCGVEIPWGGRAEPAFWIDLHRTVCKHEGDDGLTWLERYPEEESER